jgi:D-lactate dehydrogenase
MIKAVCYDTKPWFQECFERCDTNGQIEWRFLEARLNPDTAMLAQGAQAACLFVNDAANKPSLEKLQQLGVKLLALRSAGYNHVDLDTAKKLDLRVVRVPAYSPNAVAEHALAIFLALNRKIPRAYNRVRDFNFQLNGLVGQNVAGKTVAVIGAGKIGRIVAQIFKGFEANVLAYDPYPNQEWADRHGVQFVDFNEALTTADIISLHVPLTPETCYMLNKYTLPRVKKGAYIINTSRGKLIETSALLDVLRQGHLGGVALDVYEEEEGVFFEDLSERGIADDDLARLLTFPNVLVTSHQAFLTREALDEIVHITSENILRWSRGEPFLPGTELA